MSMASSDDQSQEQQRWMVRVRVRVRVGMNMSMSMSICGVAVTVGKCQTGSDKVEWSLELNCAQQSTRSGQEWDHGTGVEGATPTAGTP